MTYTIQSSQSLSDIALIVYGDVRGVFWLIEDNPDTLAHLADRLIVGTILQLRAEQINPRYVAYLAQYGPIATAETEDFPVGIGAWWLSEYVVSPPGPVNLATMATVSVSTSHPAFPNYASVLADPLPPVWSWGAYGWNDFTPFQGEDILILTWPSPVTFTSVEVLGLTADLGYTYDPTITSPYALSTYDIIESAGVAGHNLATVQNNTFAYVKSTFAPVTTTQLRIRVLDSVDHEWTRIIQVRVINIQ